MRCYACPRQCGAERTENTPSAGFCKMPYNAVLARAALHLWEEPPLSAHGGAGAVFFSGCSLRCVFCQNHAISHENFGKPVTVERFIEILKTLEAAGAQNIDLVNPTHFAPFLQEALTRYKPRVPVVYNTGGYDTVETLKSLSGLVDIYLPDFKYMSASLARAYSAAPDYPDRAKAALLEMRRQTRDALVATTFAARDAGFGRDSALDCGESFQRYLCKPYVPIHAGRSLLCAKGAQPPADHGGIRPGSARIFRFGAAQRLHAGARFRRRTLYPGV